VIRVMNVISDTNIGGAGRVLLNYLRYAGRERFETLVALPRGSLLKAPLEEAGGRVLEVDGIADRSFDRGDVKALRALIARERPDLVHTHGCFSGRVAARREGVPVIYSRHSAFPVPARLRYPPGRWVNKLVNEHYADRIIAVSPAAAKNLTDGGISPKRIAVMMNGVAPVVRRPQAEAEALRRQWDAAPEDFVLGILARLEDYKGHMDILQALAILRDEGRPVKLVIAGVGPYEQKLREETARLGLEAQVRFLGFVTDVAPLLSALDLQLNASYGTETSSLSILEGMSMGLPAVVSDYGGNPWLIDDGEDGLLFPTRDAAALARAVARLMDAPETLGRMGERAEEIFRQRFTGEIFAKNIENVYLDTLKGAK
jgi:glycosyltransferase involved in cell wall biosynthesis